MTYRELVMYWRARMAASWDQTAILRVQMIACATSKGDIPKPDTLNPFRLREAKLAKQQSHENSLAEMKRSLPRVSQKVPESLLREIIGG